VPGYSPFGRRDVEQRIFTARLNHERWRGDVGVVGSEDAGCRAPKEWVEWSRIHECRRHGKTLVSLDTAIFAIGVDWRPQFAAAALLGVYLLQCLWLVRVQTLHASGTDSDQALRIYIGLQQWKGGAIAGTPASLRSKQPPACLLRRRSGHLRVRRRIRPRPVAVHYLIAAVPFLVRRHRGPPVCHSGMCWPQRPIVLRRHAGWIALVCRAPSLWKRVWIHRTRALLLLSRDDRSVAGAQVLERWRRLGCVRRGVDAIAVRTHCMLARGWLLWNWAADIYSWRWSLALAAGTSSRSVW